MIEIFMNSYKDGHEVYLNDKERDKLVEYIRELQEDNEENKSLNGKINIMELSLNEKDKEIERLHSIIKEVREKIVKDLDIGNPYVEYDFGTELLRQELLEILDKEN